MDSNNGNAMLSDLFSSLLNSSIYDILKYLVPMFGAYVWKLIKDSAEANTDFGRRHVTAIEIISTFVYWSAAIYVYYRLAIHYPSHIEILLTALCLLLFLMSVRKVYHLSNLRAVGIFKADLEINKGTDYRKALQMCHTSLMFLGVGAFKLTSLREFEEAVTRCQQHSDPIRLLLSHPDNPLIQTAARRAGLNEQDYRSRIIDSLRIIKTIRDRGNYNNLKVRFYPNASNRDYQQFRLMFIDNKTCLVSYTVWGTGDGSHIPQLHIKNAGSQDATRSFYYPFKNYFDDLWDESSEWNFQDHI